MKAIIKSCSCYLIKTNKSAKIPYKIDCTIEVLAKSGK